MEKEEHIERGNKKLFSLVWGQCTEVMKTELKSMSNYEQLKEDQDGIELIKTIKCVTFSFRDQNYIIGSVWKAYQRIFTLIQQQDTDLKDHLEKVQNIVEVFESYGINIGEDEAIYSEDEIYKEVLQEEQKNEARIH